MAASQNIMHQLMSPAHQEINTTRNTGYSITLNMVINVGDSPHYLLNLGILLLSEDYVTRTGQLECK